MKMNRSYRATIMAVFLLAVTCAAALAAEKVALITDVKGKVLVRAAESSEWRQAFLTELLREGDLVKVTHNSRAVITYFGGNTREIITGPAVLSVGREGGTVKEGTAGQMSREPVQSSLAIPRKVKTLASYKPLGIVQRPSEALPMTLVSPGPGTIECRPTFAWIKIAKADTYHFLLFHISDGTLINTDCTENSLVYPGSAEPLKPGNEYLYKIEALREGEVIDTCGGKIKVLSPQEVSRIEEARRAFRESLEKDKDDTSAYISMIIIYLDHSLHYDALDLCRKLSTLRPEDREIHEWLRDFYGTIGDQEEEARECEILERLKRE